MKEANKRGTAFRIILAFIVTWALLPLAAWSQAPVAGDPGTCFVVADEGNEINPVGNGGTVADILYVINRTTGVGAQIGLTGTFLIEAIAYEQLTDLLYATDGGDLVTLDWAGSGTNSFVGTVGSGTGLDTNGASVVVFFDDIDSLSFDYSVSPPVLYGTQRVDPGLDLLIQIDPNTGFIVPGAFAGADYVTIIPPPTGEQNIDDIAIDCQTGIMYGIANDRDNSTADRLVIINKATGVTTDVGSTTLFDMEGLDFGADGVLFGTTGNNGGLNATNTANSSFVLGFPGSVGFGAATDGIRVVDVNGDPIGYDLEALACPITPPEITISIEGVGDGCDCDGAILITVSNGATVVTDIIITNDTAAGCNFSIPILVPFQQFTLSCDAAGTVTVTASVTVQDCLGREATAVATETVTPIPDDTAPTLVNVPADATINCGDPLPPATVTASDPCTDDETIGVNVTTTLVCPDEVERVWTAMDECGNVVSATQTITIADYALTITGVPADAEFSCVDPIPGVTAQLTQNCNTIGLAAPGTTVNVTNVIIPRQVCYAITDEGVTGGTGSGATIPDALFLVNEVTGEAEFIGPTLTSNVEAMAFDPDTAILYAFNGADLVTVDYLGSGAATSVDPAGANLTGNGPNGAVTFNDLDAAGFDDSVATPVLYAIQRNNANDLLVQIDPATGAIVSNAFNGGTTDYAVVGAIGTLDNVDDLAIDPATGVMYGILNDSDNTTPDELVIIDKDTGAITDLPGDTGIFDVEGLDFSNTGELVGSTGNNGDAPGTANSVLTFGIPGTPSFGTAMSLDRVVDSFGADLGYDFEAFSCITFDETIAVTAVVEVVEAYNNLVNLDSSSTTNTPDACTTIITRLWTGSDACDTIVTATQVITIVDDVAPVLTGIPADVSAECVPPAPPQVGATDACTTPTINPTSSTAPGACPNESVITRIWTATDECGNSVSATQVVTITDNTAPIISGVPADTSVECDAIPAPATPSALDNCEGAVTPVLSETSSSVICPNSYTIERVWTATDACGNASAATQTITVVDTTDPTLALTALATLTGDENCEALVPAVPATVTDNCSDAATVTVTQTPAAGTTVSGSGMITVVAMDECGNATTSMAPYTVDCAAPVIELLKTVYVGHDLGASCPGTEVVTATTGSNITYCFEVMNPGPVALTNVVVNDATIAMPAITIGDLAVGASAIVFFETTSVGAFTNIADVTGEGPDGTEVEDEDPAEVEEDFVSIGSTVFLDNDNSGTQDAGEPGIAGVFVEVLDMNGVVVGSATTDVNGDYFVDGLLPGTYTIRITTPPAVAPTSSTSTATGDDGVDGDDNGDQPGGAGTPVTSGPITLTVDGEPVDATETEQGNAQDAADDNNGDMTVDFGFIPEVSIGSTVFLDPNDNGEQDAGEPGIAGVAVELFDAGPDGAIGGGDDVSVGTATTDGNGDYFFDGLAPGDYFVVVTPDADAETSSSTTDTADNQEDGDDNGTQAAPGDDTFSPVISLVGDDEPIGFAEGAPTGSAQDDADDDNGDMTIDFGFIPDLVSIGSTVFLDADDSGTQDAGEAGIAGVAVELFDAGPDGAIGGGDDVSVGTATTDGNGDYFFGDLAPGDYFVVVTPDANAETSSTPTDTADNQEDGDDNGTQAAPGDDTFSPVITLAPGTEPDAAAETAPTGGAQDDTADTDGDMTIDFGFIPDPVSLGSTVFLDPNDNGEQDATEPGIPGVLVEIYDAGDTPGVDTPVDTATTDANGDYLFEDLAEGDYIVYIPTPPTAAPTSSGPTDTADNQEDGDDNGIQAAAGDPVSSPVITLTAGGEPTATEDAPTGGTQDDDADEDGDMTVDFGFVPDTVSLGSTVFLDEDDDGLQGAAEPGIAGVLVEIYEAGDTPGVDTPVATATTDGNGDFLFDDLAEGDYVVYIPTPPAAAPTSSGPTDTADNQEDGDDNGTQAASGDPVTSPVITLTIDGEPVGADEGAPTGGAQDDATDDNNGDMTVDFGFVPEPELVSLGSTVFEDTDDNGMQDAGEAGIPGILVELYEAGDTPGVDTPVGTATTDADGDFLFTGLDEGTYFVYIPTPPADAETSSSVTDTADNQEDGDDNGTQAASGDPVQSPDIVLTADGEPVGAAEGAPTGGDQDDGDDDNGDMTVDFGFVPDPVSLGSTVFEDPNDNGMQDAGEMGIPGVMVQLFEAGDDPTADTPVATATTDADGDFLFDGLDEGTYFVYIPTPPATAPTSSSVDDTADNQEDGDDNGSQAASGDPVQSPDIVLTAGTEPAGADEDAPTGGDQDDTADEDGDMTVDFGFVPTPDLVSLGSTVFEDTDDNGLQDAGEMGIAGVAVELFEAGDDPTLATPVATATTDSNGDYIFADLDEGTYFVYIPTPPATAPTSSSVTDTADNQEDGDDNGTQAASGDPVQSPDIVLTADGEPTGADEDAPTGGDQDDTADDDGDMTVDFGFVPAADPVSLGSTVFEDIDDNGMQDAGEMGIAGVVVELFEAGDDPTLDTPIATDTTDSNGDFLFDGLDEGTYFVYIPTPPASAPLSSTVTDTADNQEDGDDNGIQAASGDPVQSPDIVLTADGEPAGADEDAPTGGDQDDADDDNGDMTVDFGFVILGSISGNVGEDTNDDDAPEDPIAGVTVSLLDDTGAVIATTVTDMDGNYLFPDLPAGDYTVVETQPPGFDDVTEGDTAPDATDSTMAPDTVLDNELTVTLAPGEDDEGNDFVEEQTTGELLGSIAGNVGEDTNDDDAPEDPIAGVTIQLLDDTGAVVATTMTDMDGNYVFPNLPAGDYTVVEVQPAGFDDVTEGDTAPDATDSTMAPDTVLDNELPVTLAAGEDDVGNDFVEEELLGSIAGNVGEDTNNDDAPEDPIAGVTIELLDDTGAVIATTMTDIDGNYIFPDLPAGDYTVVEMQPAGFDDVTEGDTAPDATDSTMAPDTVLDNELAVTLAAGEDDIGNDFVEEVLGSIAGNVGEDTNNDDAPEDPIAGVTIQLLDDMGTVIATTTTDMDGNYLFPDLPAGDYTVVEMQPAGFDDVTEGDTAPDATDSTMAPDTVLDNELPVTLAAGEDDVGNDFVEEAPLGSIAGNVGEDTNNDDAPEDPIAGVIIQLLDDTGAVIAGTTTDADGDYLFPDLPAGDYTVVEMQPAGFDDVTEGDTAPDATDSTMAPDAVLDNELPVTLAAGEDDVGNDFVEELLGSISGNVGEDTNDDDAPEDPIAGVTIQLLDDTGAVIATTMTDSNGDYTFPNLPAGDYTVVETQPPGFDDVTEGDTAPDATDSTMDPDSVIDNELAVTLAAGEDDEGNDFVEELIVDEPLGSISGNVGEDTNDDDAPEDPIAGVTIQLLDDTGAVVATIMTDSNGDYMFPNLPAGDYTVVETQPPGFDDVTEGDTAPDATDSTMAPDPVMDNELAVTLGAGEDDEGNDFVEEQVVGPLGSISGNVGEDTNGDDAPEAPIEGVTIQLLDDTGAVVATTMTDSNGDYVFTSLPAGDYTVVETQPLGFDDVTEGDTAPDATDPTMASDTVQDNQLAVTLGEGEDDEGNDFVEEVPSGSISGSVGEDTNGDDAPEDPIEGVTIQLLDDTGVVVATTTTDADGDYEFTDLPAGDYIVVEVQPAGFDDVTEGDTTPDATDPTMAPDTLQDNQLPVTIGPGEDDDGNDFVEEMTEEPVFTVGSTVFQDVNDNGIQDAGELGFEGILVEVVDSTGTVVGSATTDANGDYLIDMVPEGTYTIRITTPPASAPMSSTPSNLGDDGVDSDDNGDQPGGSGTPVESGPITLTDNGEPIGEPGQAGNQDAADDDNGEMTIDFGFVPTVSIGSSLFEDTNDNGMQDPGEAGISGVLVEVYAAGDTPGVDAPVGSATSDVNGEFVIGGLLEGDYFLYIPTPPASAPTSSAVTDTTDNQEDNDDNGEQLGGSGAPVTSPIISLTVGGEPAGETGLGGTQDDLADTNGDMTIDFGFVPDATAVNPGIDIEKTTNGEQADTGTGPFVPVGGGVTWIYTVMNTGDVDLANVTVTDSDLGLICTIASLPVGATETCTANGSAVAGQYENVADATGTPVDSTGAPLTDPTGNPIQGPTDSDVSHYFGANPGIDVDKTVVLGAATAADCPGTELVTGNPGGTVTYCIIVQNTGNTFLSNVQVNDTLIGFSDTITLLAPGAAEVFAVTDTIAGSLVNTASASGNPSDPTGGDIPGLPDPSDTDTAEVQEVPPVLIGNLVFEDLNGDGIQTIGEPGVPSVQVVLQDAAGNIVATTTTDASGNYEFSVPPGNYQILVNPTTLPANFMFTDQNVGTDDGADSDVNPATGLMPLTGFLTSDNFSFDAGIVPQPATLGDTVWSDANANGIPDEMLDLFGIEGIQVDLFQVNPDGSETLIDSTITGPNGSYEFGDLAPGTYRTEVLTDNLPANVNPTGTTPLSYEVTLGPGDNVDTHDFGFAPVVVAIELEFFDAELTTDGVAVSWRTAWEENTLGYFVYRVAADGTQTLLNERLILAQGGGNDYGFVDAGATGGRYILEEIETDLDRSFQTIVAYAQVDAAPVGVPTQTLQADNNVAVFETDSDYSTYLVVGFDVIPQVLDVTDPENPLELIGEMLTGEAGNAAYFSAPGGLSITVKAAEVVEE